jgi:predicted translin family RNA/ssDNA-binding protein
MKVRALWELSRVQASGNVSAARTEGITPSRELLKDSKATDVLALAYGNAEEANPNFEKNISRLSELARRVSGFL